MDLAIIAAVFPIIFVGELPDKTMFASLVMASRGHPFAVWLGAAAAFAVHVVIAVTIGVAIFRILPTRAVEALVTVLFLGGAFLAFREASSEDDEIDLIEREAATHSRVTITAFFVIFVAEWGDLTQILTANLAAHYRSGLNVAIGAVLALWAVAGIAVLSGQGLMKYVPVPLVRRITGVVLVILAGVSAVAAFRG
jgi:putative Ca2+/H+ antiporter (TMEM165/GDT1 family)